MTVAQELRLDDNLLTVLGSGDLGPHASALQTLSMLGSHFSTVSTLCRNSCCCSTRRASVPTPNTAGVEQHSRG